MPHETKSTNAELENRVTLIYELLVIGMRRSEIHNYIRNSKNKLNWNVNDDQVNVYIQKAKAEIKKFHDISRKTEIRKTLVKYDVLYKRAYMSKNWGACIGILKNKMDMLGYNAPKRKEITKKIDKTVRSKRTALKQLEDMFEDMTNVSKN